MTHPSCERFPVLWAPDDGWTEGDCVLGVKWRCAACGIEGAPVFGSARDLPEISADALKVFLNGPAVGVCVYWTTPVEHFVG